jgi:uncharacterized protein YvpB
MLLSHGFPYELGFVIFIATILIFILNNVAYFLRWRKRKRDMNLPAIIPPADIELKVENKQAQFVEGLTHDIESDVEVDPIDDAKPKLTFKRLFQPIAIVVTKAINFWQRTRKYSWILINVICIVGIGYWGYDLFVYPLGVNYNTPMTNEIWLDSSKPIVIQFDRAFRQDKLVPQMQPEILGKWKYEDMGISFLPRRVVFYPEESVLPGHRVVVYLANVSNMIETPDGTWDKVEEFNSANIPSIINTVPTDGSVAAGTADPVAIELDNPDGNFVSWEVAIQPEVPYELKRDNSTHMQISFPTPLAQNTKYTLIINKRIQAINPQTGEILVQDEPTEEKRLIFTTVKAPALSGSEPTGDRVRPDSQIKLVFDKPMVRDSVEKNLTVEPATEIALHWTNDKELLIAPKTALAKDTNYIFKIAKGAKSDDGGVIEQDILHTFKTLGPVKVVSTSPGNGAGSVTTSNNIRIELDQEVDHASAQSKFSISPNVAGAFSWDGNVIVFNPNESLEYSKKYTVNLAAGIKSTYGLDGNANYTFSFTTRPQSINLNIPLTIQPYRYACNLTAAKMVLAYRGVSVSVDTLYSQVAKDNTAWDSATNTWGNPNSGFVGDLHGVSKGYGVHWGPVSNLIGKYRGNSIKTGWNTTDLLKEVEAGNPVIIWAHNGYSGSGTNTTWNLPSSEGGGTVYTVKGMHSYVVKGFVGPPENPSSIKINDPNLGARDMSLSYFNSLWGTFNRTAIVVR